MMTPQEIEDNKQRFIALCHENIKRDGLEKVLSYLENSDFYTAPSSTNYHLNEDGGLCKHSMNVFETACKLYDQVASTAISSGQSPFTEEVTKESIAISTLFHDLCKVKLYHKATRWKKDANNHWISYEGYEIKDDFPLGHGEKSCLILGWFMRLKQEEMLAIRWHMGMFDMGENGTSQRYSFYAALEKNALVSIVHAADFLSSRLLEKTTEH